MFNPNHNHVRRSTVNQHRYPDGRSNSQPIPRNPGLASNSRGGGTAPNYSYNTIPHGQQAAPYAATSPSMYPAVSPAEMNSSQAQVAPPLSMKQHANGQIAWTGQRMQFATQPQHPGQHQNAYQAAGSKYSKHVQNSGQYPTYPQSTSNMMPSAPSYIYVRNQQFSNSHSVVTQPHQPMPSSSPGYYQPAAQAYFPNQISPVPYAPPFEPMPYPPGSQPAISAPVMQPHAAPSSMPPPKKKAIKIIDPDTMQEVDVVRTGNRTESESSTHSRSSPPTVTTHPQQDDQIAAQFAAKVAAAATDAPDKQRTSSSSDAPPATANVVDPSISNEKTNSNATANVVVSQAGRDHSTSNGSVLNSEAKEFTNGLTAPPTHHSKTDGIRPTPHVALVQPLPHPPPEALDVPNKPPIPRVAKILSRGEALPPLKDSKDKGGIEPPINDEVFDVKNSSESFESSAEPVRNSDLNDGAKTPSKTTEDPSTSSEASLTEKQSLDNPSLPNPAPIKAEENVSSEIPSDTQAHLEKEEPKEEKQEPEVPETSKKIADEATTKPMETVSSTSESTPSPQAAVKEVVPNPADEESKLNTKALSGGNPAVKESSEKLQNNPPPPKVESQIENKPNVIQAPPPVKSQASREGSSEKEVAKLDPILKSESAERKKVQYERDFLIKCRDHESTREKPSLPNLPDIVMEQCLSHVSTSLPSLGAGYGGGSDFTPNWMMGRNPRMERQSSRGSQGGQGRQGYYPQQMQQQKVIKKVSIQREPEPELNKAENAWKPTKMEGKTSSADSTEESQTAEILKAVRAILNKLTPQKFTPLMKKFKDLPINTENRLREVINIVFEKAIDEPNFCEAYANMCRVMSQLRVTAPAEEGGNQNQGPITPKPVVEFRKVLISRCQKEFEKDRTSENALSDLRKKVDDATTEEEKKTLREDLEYAEAKERWRIMGNIRFIGELFKLGMLTEQIMHNCIMSLFKARDEESLESLCKLLTTIGNGLDHVKGKHLMDQYFTQIDKIISERKISSRVKFMLIDVKDLRKNNWVQRAIKAQGPKTIDQIHQDAKDEKEQMALKASVAAGAGKSQSRGNRMGSRNSSSHNLAEDGWQNVTQKPMRIDPQKMKFSKIDESNVTLGPNRGKQMWKSGSGSVATKTGSGGFSYRDADGPSAPRSMTPTTMNRFSALSGVGNQDAFYPSRSGGRISSQERTKSGSRGSGRDERQSALDTVRRLTSAERKPPSTGAPPPTPKAPALLTEANDAVLKKIDSIIVEYLHLQDVKEATECFEELKLAPTLGHVIVKSCLEGSLEKLAKDRANISRLLCSLVRSSKLAPNQFSKGVASIMELAVDVELDLPKVWTCVAELVSSTLHASAGKVGLNSLKEMAAPLLPFDKADIFLAEILKQIIKEQTGANKILHEWRNSSLQIEYFMKTDDSSTISAFLDKHGLRAFYDAADVPEVTGDMTSSRLNFYDLVKEITRQLDTHLKDDPIFDWVEAKTTPQERTQPVFLRALVTAVCNKAIIQGAGQPEVNKELVTSRSNLLRKFLVSEDKELQAVYALQRLFVDLEQPPNVLKLLFDSLYDEDVISEVTFFKWEESNDPNELEGKGVALLSVKPFLTWLRNADVESDE